MLSMTLQAAPTLKCICEQSACGSLFKDTERMIDKYNEYSEAIKWVGRSKNIDRYFDLVDFVFCETFTQWRYSCFKYYEETGPKFKDHQNMIPEMIHRYDAYMVHFVLPTALDLYKLKDTMVSWKGFRRLILDKLIANDLPWHNKDL